MFDKPHRLHPAAVIINSGLYLKRFAGALIAPIAATFASNKHSSAQVMALMIGGIVVAVGAIALVGPVLHYFSTYFYIENGALEINSGFVWRKKRTIPLARIQNVNLERTLWHRILGAASVKVETAAGGGVEGELAALSIADANKLQAVLLQKQVTSEEEQPAEAAKPEALYELSTRQVILAGALGNRAMYIIAGIFGVFQFDRLGDSFYKPVANYLSHVNPVVGALMGALAFFGLIVLGWLVSIGVSATRFFGFRIERHEKGLLLSHGLITQFRTIVPVGRIQAVRIVQPIFFRAFGYSEVYADTAGSFDKKDVASANKICPILPEGETNQIGKLLLNDFEFLNLDWRNVSPKTVRRHALRSLNSFALFLLIPLAFLLKWKVLWLLIPLAPYCWLLGVLYYRFVGYSFTEHVVASRQGVFRKQAVVIPFDRIQHYSINSSPFQRWLGLASVSAVSAASGGHPISIVDVEAEAAESLRETLSSSIRSHLGSRRGGL